MQGLDSGNCAEHTGMQLLHLLVITHCHMCKLLQRTSVHVENNRGARHFTATAATFGCKQPTVSVGDGP